MLAVLASLLTPCALAQFMKPGASPEAGFAGVWRVIGANPAPWAPPMRSNAKTPLLEYAVQFSEHEAKGPASLACEHALFSSGVTARDDAFGGKLKEAQGARADELKLASGSITTFRVICDGAVRDYYVDGDANLVTLQDGIVYTLQRPTGMDPGQYTAGFSGPSFDCSKAASAGERTICRDAALSKADRRLDAAYRRLKSTETAQSFATVQKAQRDWLAFVSMTCGAGGPMPDDLDEKNNLEECLEDNYGDRAERLEGVGVLAAGTLVLEPRMRLLTRAKPATEESDIYPWMSGGAEAAPFNAYVSKALALDKRRMDDKDLFPFGDDVADMSLYARRTYAVKRFDTRVVSLLISTYDYTGGAHEALDEKALNWDVAQARPISLQDVFAKDKPWQKFVTDFCIADLHDESADQPSPDPDRAAVARVVADGDSWLWGKEAATVHFTVYTIASFAGGEFDVDIPYSDLKPYLRSHAPVP